MNEMKRIREIYSARDRSGKRNLYSWYLPSDEYMVAMKSRLIASAIRATVGNELGDLKVLDVGCGTGGFLRSLVGWGASPENMVGTEFLADRLEKASEISPVGMRWHLGGLDFDDGEGYDIVCAHTVFSSILDDEARRTLAKDMWKTVRPGGWVMVFDFRYNNPSNQNVRKVKKDELRLWWPSAEQFYRTGLLAPPLSRRLIKDSFALAELLTLTLPFLRSHFVFMARK